VRRIETEQTTDNSAALQDELIQAAERERQLQMQLDKLDKLKDDVSQFRKWLEQRSNLQKDFDDFKLEQEMKQRDSKFSGFQ